MGNKRGEDVRGEGERGSRRRGMGNESRGGITMKDERNGDD